VFLLPDGSRVSAQWVRDVRLDVDRGQELCLPNHFRCVFSPAGFTEASE
jgi:hypothetical protein